MHPDLGAPPAVLDRSHLVIAIEHERCAAADQVERRHPDGQAIHEDVSAQQGEDHGCAEHARGDAENRVRRVGVLVEQGRWRRRRRGGDVDHIGRDGATVLAGADCVFEIVADLRPLGAFPDRLHMDIELRPVGPPDESEATLVDPVFQFSTFTGHAAPRGVTCWRGCRSGPAPRPVPPAWRYRRDWRNRSRRSCEGYAA